MVLGFSEELNKELLRVSLQIPLFYNHISLFQNCCSVYEFLLLFQIPLSASCIRSTAMRFGAFSQRCRWTSPTITILSGGLTSSWPAEHCRGRPGPLSCSDYTQRMEVGCGCVGMMREEVASLPGSCAAAWEKGQGREWMGRVDLKIMSSCRTKQLNVL